MVGVGVDHAGFLADDMKVDIIVTASGDIGRPVSVKSLDGGRDVKGFAPYPARFLLWMLVGQRLPSSDSFIIHIHPKGVLGVGRGTCRVGGGGGGVWHWRRGIRYQNALRAV